MSMINFNEDKDYKKYLDTKKNITQDEKSAIKKYNSNIDKNYIIDPFENEDYKAEYNFYRENPDEIFAYLIIDKLDLKKPIYLDASNEHLAKGVAHVYGTALPIGEKGGRSVIAGQRGYFRDTMFVNLHKLVAGDEIIINRDNDKLKYIVSDTKIITQTSGKNYKPKKIQI